MSGSHTIKLQLNALQYLCRDCIVNDGVTVVFNLPMRGFQFWIEFLSKAQALCCCDALPRKRLCNARFGVSSVNLAESIANLANRCIGAHCIHDVGHGIGG